MVVLLLILIAIFIVGLNFESGDRKKSTKKKKATEVLKEPVARSYKVLYWYVAVHVLYDIGHTAWDFIHTRPWGRYTPQYVAKYHEHHTVPYLQQRDKIVILSFLVFYLCLYAYMLTSKRPNNLFVIFVILFGFDVLNLPYVFHEPTYQLVFNLAMFGFTFLVLFSLRIREPDFLKLLRAFNK